MIKLLKFIAYILLHKYSPITPITILIHSLLFGAKEFYKTVIYNIKHIYEL